MTPSFLTVAACTSAMAGAEDENVRHREAGMLLDTPRAAAETAILCMIEICYVVLIYKSRYRKGRVGRADWNSVTSQKTSSGSASLGQAFTPRSADMSPSPEAASTWAMLDDELRLTILSHNVLNLS
jgi:hypothetical protein